MTDLKPPCILYDTSFKPSNLEKTKLQQDFQEGSRKQSCPVFTGTHGIEGLLYVEERFRKIASQLQWTDGDELFDNFELILADNAELAWENITSNIPDAQRTPQRFDEALKEFYL